MILMENVSISWTTIHLKMDSGQSGLDGPHALTNAIPEPGAEHANHKSLPDSKLVKERLKKKQLIVLADAQVSRRHPLLLTNLKSSGKFSEVNKLVFRTADEPDAGVDLDKAYMQAHIENKFGSSCTTNKLISDNYVAFQTGALDTFPWPQDGYNVLGRCWEFPMPDGVTMPSLWSILQPILITFFQLIVVVPIGQSLERTLRRVDWKMGRNPSDRQHQDQMQSD